MTIMELKEILEMGHISPHIGELMTDMIDLTAYSDVTLMAHSYFRTFMGQAFVAFYVNGVYDSINCRCILIYLSMKLLLLMLLL